MRQLLVRSVVALFLFGLCACAVDSGPNPPIGQAEPPAPPPEPAPVPEEAEPPPALPDLAQSQAVPSMSEDERRRYAAILWKTSLGKQYQDFLFTDYPRELFPKRCEQLAERIVSETKKTASRIAALQIMNEDLYVTARMTDEIRSRIQLLETEIENDRAEVQKSAVKSVFQQAPLLFIASLPWGSPLIRAETRSYMRQSANYAFSYVRRRPPPEYRPVPWPAVFSAKAFENYEIGRPVTLFVKTIGPFSVFELFLVKDVAGNLSGDATLEEMIMMADF